jgi:hypothetical protein
MNVDFKAAEAVSEVNEGTEILKISVGGDEGNDNMASTHSDWESPVLAAHANWESRVRAAGVYEREMERQRIIARNYMFHRDRDEGDEALDYEEWLDTSVTLPEFNYSSPGLAYLRQLDRWLWEYKPIPHSADSVTNYLFDWDDVVTARASGEITSEEQWVRHVNQRYYAEWLKYNVRYLQAELDPYQECESDEQECESDENVPSVDLDDPDKYAYWLHRVGNPTLWKAIARFPADSELEAITLETKNVDPSSCIREGYYGKWYVDIPHEIAGIPEGRWEKPASIPLGEWYEKDDALACAIEGIRCLQPNTRFSETELAHQATTMDRRKVELAVAGLIGRWFYTHGRDRFPAHVEAILALDSLYKHDGQFERDSNGVWQLWCEARYPLRSEFISCAEPIPNEISEALDRTWGKFMSRKLREGFRNTQAT